MEKAGAQSALVLVGLGAEGAEEERGAGVEGVGCRCYGKDAVAGINDNESLERAREVGMCDRGRGEGGAWDERTTM
jgi:hypothetical protein